MDFSMLVVNSNRSKAYLQNMVRHGHFPRKVILLEDEKSNSDKTDIGIKNSKNDCKSIKKFNNIELYFDEREHVSTTLENNGIDYTIVKTLDVNDPIVGEEIKKINEKKIIFSGPGGVIISEKILSLGKEFIHVHPGWVPEYRGSTTMYYSLLVDSNICCSVIVLDKEIDTGDILLKKKYDVPNRLFDYDYVVDPILRADSLINYLDLEDKKMICRYKQSKDGNTFYIIHPLLKNMAILKHNDFQNSFEK